MGEQQIEAVRLVKTSGKPLTQLAEDLGVSKASLSRWCQEYGTSGEQAFVGRGNLSPEDEELKQLRRELEVLRQERDILKKPHIEYLVAELSPMMPRH